MRDALYERRSNVICNKRICVYLSSLNTEYTGKKITAVWSEVNLKFKGERKRLYVAT